MNELFGLAEIPVYGSAVAQSYGDVPPAPPQEHIPDTPSSLKYGALYPAPFPSLTTNDCFVGIAKYLLKSYPTLLFGTSGFGFGAVPLRHIPSYTTTSPFDIGTTFPAESTQSHTTLPVAVGDVWVRRDIRSHETLFVPLSRVSLAVRAAPPVPIPIFPLSP